MYPYTSNYCNSLRFFLLESQLSMFCLASQLVGYVKELTCTYSYGIQHTRFTNNTYAHTHTEAGQWMPTLENWAGGWGRHVRRELHVGHPEMRTLLNRPHFFVCPPKPLDILSLYCTTHYVHCLIRTPVFSMHPSPIPRLSLLALACAIIPCMNFDPERKVEGKKVIR